MTVPALDADPNHVATISTNVVSDLLEKQLGFRGSLSPTLSTWPALLTFLPTTSAERPSKPLKLETICLLFPADLPASYHSMVKAVSSGEISR